MINRLIYNGKVYYKVADLAQLFDVSLYKMRKIVKLQGIGAPLPKGSGYGRALFVMEENVAKIEVRNEVKILETKFTADPVKEVKVVKEPVIDVKESKKPAKKAEKKNAENVTPIEIKVENESNIDEIEKIQEEHARLLEKARYYGVKFSKKGKMSIIHAICDKHLGKGNNLLNSTPDDIKQVQSAVAEIEIEYAKLKDSSNEIGEVKISDLSSEVENVGLTESFNESELAEVHI